MSEFSKLNPIKEPEKVKRLLGMNKHNLTSIESQTRYVLERHLTQMPCPVCHEKCNVYEAADGTKTVGDIYEGEFKCPACEVILVQVVPFFMGAGPGWHWARKHPPTAEERAKLRELHRAKKG